MSKHGTLIQWEWDGELMVPMKRFQHLCDREFVIGERYKLEAVEERSWASHRHQFAWLRTAWENLPEDLCDQPYAHSAENLRKHALIKTGFCYVSVMEFGSKAAAMRAVPKMQLLATIAHGYCILVPRDTSVQILTPHSQSVSKMGKAEFQRSKEAVLEWVAQLLKTTPEDLTKAGEAA